VKQKTKALVHSCSECLYFELRYHGHGCCKRPGDEVLHLFATREVRSDSGCSYWADQGKTIPKEGA
jgi:hypothetical protein